MALITLLDAKTYLRVDSSDEDWIAEDRIQKKTQQYLEEGFRELSGEKFVSSMPVEFAEFITDCYLCLKHN